MKRIPAGILLLTLAFSSPVLTRLLAAESAAQLAEQELGPDQSMKDESASQLSDRDLGPDQSMKDESASQLSNQDLGPDQSMKDESAAELSDKNLGPDQSMKDESAASLAEQDDLEKKPKVTISAPATAFGSGEGVNGVIYAAAAQADGSVIVGGNFESVNGQPRRNLARFKADGSLDTTYFASPTGGVEGTVYALAIDAKGNVLVGGYFTVNPGSGPAMQNFVRYVAGGGLDTAFQGQSPNGAVYAITVQPAGTIVIGGEFTQVGEQPRRNLARFKADGTLDGPVASADATTGAVRSLITLPGGGILAGGSLEIEGQTARNLLVAP